MCGFLNILVDTYPLIALFWTSGDFSFGFQTGQPYSHLADLHFSYV